MRLIIPGEPTGKARPRVTKWGTHSTEKTVLYENLVKLLYHQQCKGQTKGQICVQIEAIYGIPKSTAKKYIPDMLSGKIRPCKKPDVDNIAKIVCDALNGVAYKDDSQICSLTVNKIYGEKPRVEVQIKELEC